MCTAEALSLSLGVCARESIFVHRLRCRLDIALNSPYVAMRLYRTFDDGVLSPEQEQSSSYSRGLKYAALWAAYTLYYLQYAINVLYLWVLYPLLNNE